METQREPAWRDAGFASRAVHAGERARHHGFTPTGTPIYPSSAFYYDDVAVGDAVFGGERPGFVYTRHGNPTVGAFETAVAALEGTEAAVAFASGMAALHAAVLAEVRSGSRIVAARALYGATTAMLNTIFATLGVETAYVDVFDLDEVERVLAETKPRALVFETIANPLVQVADIPALVAIARRHRVTTICDNTFATPCLVNPAALGVDVVVHSATKYLGGHGDVTGGVIATGADRAFELIEIAKLTGGILGPFEAWLALRGIKTLPLRVGKQCANAAALAAWLAAHPKVARVHYPGLDGEPLPAVFNDGRRGGVLAFELAGADRAAAFRFLDALRLCQPATTLGDVYTLVLSPPMATHRALSPDELAAAGIGEGLLRLSAGIEDPADLIADLARALAAV